MSDDENLSDPIDPAQAREWLARADAVGAAASASASWPAVAALLGLGAATSMGTMAMALTAGAAYLACMLAMFAWLGVSLACVIGFTRSHKLGFRRRWGGYIALWAAAYAVAIALATSPQGRSVVGACVAAALILIVTVGCAWREARA